LTAGQCFWSQSIARLIPKTRELKDLEAQGVQDLLGIARLIPKTRELKGIPRASVVSSSISR